MAPISMEEHQRILREDMERKMVALPNLLEHGEGLLQAWTGLAYQDPPKDLFGRIFWSVGVFSQLIVSSFTFPAAIGNFLLEESVQAYGMGAYILSTAKAYEILDIYLVGYDKFIDAAITGAKTLGTLNPITGGAVLIYMVAAKSSQAAFRAMVDMKLLEQAETDEKLREKLLEEQDFGELRLASSPSQAEIWIDGENMELLTPETFKRLDAGRHVIELRKFSVRRDVLDVYAFDIKVSAGRKKELFIRIPPGINSDFEVEQDDDVVDEPKLPEWIKATVVGNYALDGDTIETTTGERIRLLAIDTPEIGQEWADIAKEYTEMLIEDKKLDIRIQTSAPRDVYGRTLAFVSSYKGDVSKLLLSAGLARTFIGEDAIYNPAPYLAAEQVAKDRRIGIWSRMK